jgi:hypothetical protein
MNFLPLAERVFASAELRKSLGDRLLDDPALRRMFKPTTPEERVARRMCAPLHLASDPAPAAVKPAVRTNVVSISSFRKS